MDDPDRTLCSRLATLCQVAGACRERRFSAPVQTALGKVIRAIGVKEFGERAGMAGPNVLRAIHPRHNPTQATLNRLLKPFQLRLSLARLEGPEDPHFEETSSTVAGRQPIPRSRR